MKVYISFDEVITSSLGKAKFLKDNFYVDTGNQLVNLTFDCLLVTL